MGCPLQGPEAVKEEDVEGNEDDEAGGRGQRSEVRSQGITEGMTSGAVAATCNHEATSMWTKHQYAEG